MGSGFGEGWGGWVVVLAKSGLGVGRCGFGQVVRFRRRGSAWGGVVFVASKLAFTVSVETGVVLGLLNRSQKWTVTRGGVNRS